MRTSSLMLIGALALGACTWMAAAEEDAGAPPRGQRPPPPPPPIIGTLDANKDGVIDATEIANASTALKALDKNGDGQLTRDELIPKRPDDQGEAGPPDGPLSF